MKHYKVYKYVFPDGKIYVGMTHLSLEERRDNGYQHNKELREAIRQFGWRGFEHIILADGLTKQEAEKMEIEQIKSTNANNPKFGYNKSLGGRKTFYGLKHQSSSRERISKANKGRVFSAKHINNLRASHKGLNVGKYNHKSKCVCQCDLMGNPIAIFESIRQASIITGINRSCISDCINNKQKTSHGYVWKVRW